MANSIMATTMQITNTGGLDEFLTKFPETSLFPYNYKQITPFAKHTTMLPFNEKVDFGRTLTITIPSLGDLVNSIYLYFQLPPLTLPPGSTFVGYTQSIAYAMIESVEIRIGEQTIDRQTGLFMEVMDYLTTNANKAESHYKQIGRYDTVNVLPINALSPQSIYIPLKFWFNNKLSQGLPMLTLAGQIVKLIVKLKPFSSIVTFDGQIPPIPIPIAQSGVIIDYHILSESERIDYKEETQEYLIEQWQEIVYEIPQGMSTSRFRLEFTKCIKEIVWAICETESVSNNDFFNFGRRENAYQGGEFLEFISLSFDGKERFEKLPESYFRIVLPQRHHSYAGNRNIYTLPFAEYPEANQPSGTANFSRYDSVELGLDFIDSVPGCRLYVLGINYNRLTISPDGTVQLEFLT